MYSVAIRMCDRIAAARAESVGRQSNRAQGHQKDGDELEAGLFARVVFGESQMPKATWAGKVIADSDLCVVVEGNQYFPPNAVKKEFFKPSVHTSECPWK